jgi:ubiquinone/menaquinone biosynthesis C-methylase UbiE
MFTDPLTNLKQFDLREKMWVADLGAGTGAYSLAASRLVGPDGRIFAVEVQKDLLERVKDEAKKARIGNVDFIWGDIEKIGGTKLRDNSMDRVIVSNVLFQAPDKQSLLVEARRILKPGGEVIVIDWSDSFGGMGPSPSDVVSKSSAKSLLERAGFKFEREISAGEHHYGIIFKK